MSMMEPQGGMPEASEEENAELERAWGAVAEVLWGNDKTHNALVKQMDPNDKMGSVAAVTTVVITQVDEQIDIDEGVIGGLVPPTVDGVIELFEVTQKVEFTDAEVKKALAASMEAVLATFGVEEEDYAAFLQERGIDQNGVNEAQGIYQEMLNG